MSKLAALVAKAKSDPIGTAKDLLPLMQQAFPNLGITQFTAHLEATSLNSVNGIINTAKGDLFIKAHAEEGEEVTLENSEYYRAKVLAETGWPEITPEFQSTAPGMQFVIYKVIDGKPTVFRFCGEQDERFLAKGKYDDAVVNRLLRSEAEYLDTGTAITLKTLEPGSAESEKASLHQLFSHRLISVNGSTPRVGLFYEGKTVVLPDGAAIPFNDLARKKWIINGWECPLTLAEIIALSKKQLASNAMAAQPTAITHGDDHFGNIFDLNGKFVAFDPAFAGRHPVLLGMIKHVMHNTLLHPLWYYEPAKVLNKLKLDAVVEDDTVRLTHNAGAVLTSPLRDALFDLQAKHTWHPVLEALDKKGWLWDGWQDFVRCAAFCCPFLAINMIDAERGGNDNRLPLFNLAMCLQTFQSADALIPSRLLGLETASSLEIKSLHS
jgi:hypothetical protein